MTPSRLALPLLVLMLSASAAHPQSAPPPPPKGRDAEPVWLETPTPGEIAMRTPIRARRVAPITGSVDMKCVVQPDGRLGRCVVVREAPLDQGYGDAAVQMGNLFRMAIHTADGLATAGASITVNVTFPPR